MGKRNQQVIRMLAAKYPKSFFPSGSADTKPLRIGIFTLITGQNPNIPRATVGYALKFYTTKTRYLRALATCEYRVDLDGNNYEPVSERNRARAIAALAERQAELLERAA